MNTEKEVEPTCCLCRRVLCAFSLCNSTSRRDCSSSSPSSTCWERDTGACSGTATVSTLRATKREREKHASQRVVENAAQHRHHVPGHQTVPVPVRGSSPASE